MGKNILAFQVDNPCLIDGGERIYNCACGDFWYVFVGKYNNSKSRIDIDMSRFKRCMLRYRDLGDLDIFYITRNLRNGKCPTNHYIDSDSECDSDSDIEYNSLEWECICDCDDECSCECGCSCNFHCLTDDWEYIDSCEYVGDSKPDPHITKEELDYDLMIMNRKMERYNLMKDYFTSCENFTNI